MSLTAIHIRSGEPGPGRLVDRWLEAHRVAVRDFADAYEACVYLVQQPSAAPDLAFVGADWLLPEEWPIVRYLHETWPGLGLVIYASRSVPGLPEGTVLRSVAASARTLESILELGPDNLLRSMRPAAAPLERVLESRTADAEATGQPAPGNGAVRSIGMSDASVRPRPDELWLLSGPDG
jgi:hypothetical protein